jgi:hypothetical protein
MAFWATMSAVRRATSRKAREVAHPLFFQSTSKDKPALYFPVKVAHPPASPGTTRSRSGRARWPLPPVARTPPRSLSCPEFLCGAAASPRDTAKVGNDRQRGKELHSSSMVSYRAKGINKFTFVNLAVARQQPDRKDFLLAALVSTSSPPATAGCCAAPILG